VLCKPLRRLTDLLLGGRLRGARGAEEGVGPFPSHLGPLVLLGTLIPIMPKSSKPTSAGGEPPSFEAALAELEKLVAGMESGQLSLEQSLAAHKRGLELAQFCQSKLAQAQQQVQVLEANTLQAFPGAEQDQ